MSKLDFYKDNEWKTAHCQGADEHWCTECGAYKNKTNTHYTGCRVATILSRPTVNKKKIEHSVTLMTAAEVSKRMVVICA